MSQLIFGHASSAEPFAAEVPEGFEIKISDLCVATLADLAKLPCIIQLVSAEEDDAAPHTVAVLTKSAPSFSANLVLPEGAYYLKVDSAKPVTVSVTGNIFDLDDGMFDMDDDDEDSSEPDSELEAEEAELEQEVAAAAVAPKKKNKRAREQQAAPEVEAPPAKKAKKAEVAAAAAAEPVKLSKKAQKAAAKAAAAAEKAAAAAAEKAATDKKAAATDAKASVVQKNGLEFHDVKVGGGKVLKRGKMISMRYVGRVLGSDQIFDKNLSGQPFKFRWGAGEVIAGWEQGLKGMREGGKRRVVIPAKLGYGSQAQEGIPANSTLDFVVQVVKMH